VRHRDRRHFRSSHNQALTFFRRRRPNAMRAVFTTYRSLLKRPAFFLAVVLTLTLGIGANSAIF
jgi:hypothetical protein